MRKLNGRAIAQQPPRKQQVVDVRRRRLEIVRVHGECSRRGRLPAASSDVAAL